MHFDQLEAPKNEFEVCESHLQSLKSGYMEFLSNFIKLQNQFSQLSVGQNAKFLCLSNRFFPLKDDSLSGNSILSCATERS